jgi:uncharacterized protein (DUF2267 family)
MAQAFESPAGPFIERIERSGVLPAGMKGPEAVAAVLCPLSQRLNGGEARDLLDSLPASVRSLFESCALHPQQPEVFGRQTLPSRRRIQASLRRECPPDVPGAL